MHASSAAQTEGMLVATLLQLVIIILAARGANVLARRLGQPGAVGEIVAGLMLGPSLFGALLPDLSKAIFPAIAAAPIQVMSQIGLTLLMFQIGSDFDFGHLAHPQHRRAVLAVAVASITLPLACGFALGMVSAPILAPSVTPLIYAMFVAVAMSITAVPILGRILREYGLTRTPIGVITISAAAINDVLGWLILATIASIVTAHFSMLSIAARAGGLAFFAAVLWWIGRPAADALIVRYPSQDGLLAPGLMAIVLAAIFACGICTYELGIFVIFGGFAGGLLFHRHTGFVAAWRQQAGQFVLVFFLPIFFTYTGLRTNILGLVTVSDWLWCALFVSVGVASKIAPVYLGARWSGLAHGDALAASILMNTRALMELVVLNVGFDLGFISSKVFTMLVMLAVLSTIMTAPLLRIALRHSDRSLKIEANV